MGHQISDVYICHLCICIYAVHVHVYQAQKPSFLPRSTSVWELSWVSELVCIHIQVTYNMLLGVCHICLCRYVTYVYVYVCDIYTKSYMAYIDSHITY